MNETAIFQIDTYMVWHTSFAASGSLEKDQVALFQLVTRHLATVMFQHISG